MFHRHIFYICTIVIFKSVSRRFQNFCCSIQVLKNTMLVGWMQQDVSWRNSAKAKFILQPLPWGFALLLPLHRPPLLLTPPPASGWQLDSPVILSSAQRWEGQADWLTPGAVRCNPQLRATNWAFFLSPLCFLFSYLSIYPPNNLLLPTLWL